MAKQLGRRERNVYDPRSSAPYKLSRSKLELFIGCPRCFYLDRRLGIGRPKGPAFTLNKAVDELLKKEFDIHRARGTAHPLMKEYGIDAIPFAHEDMAKWRENFVGIQHLHRPTNFIITGAVDDIWVNHKGELIAVDYKATSTTKEITLEAEYRQSFKRQIEIYQWLLKQNGFKVFGTGYFVYVNCKTDRKAFDGKLEFDVQIIPYESDCTWVDRTINDAHKCLKDDKIPALSSKCDFCNYLSAVQNLE